VQYGSGGLDASQACTLALSLDVMFESAVESLQDSGGPALREHVFGESTPLAAGTDYYVQVTCGLETATGRFTTAQDSEPVSRVLKLSAKVPDSLGVDHVLIEYGTSPALGDSLQAPCANGCQVELPVTSGRLIYVQRKYRDAAQRVLATGSIRVVHVP
jgi:hypothetical protein